MGVASSSMPAVNSCPRSWTWAARRSPASSTRSASWPRSRRPMPTFDDVAASDAPVEDVWKLLYDPARFPEWWEGMETVEPSAEGFTMFPRGYPDFPMPQALRSDGDGHRVTVSCLISQLVFEWRLEPTAGDGT